MKRCTKKARGKSEYRDSANLPVTANKVIIPSLAIKCNKKPISLNMMQIQRLLASPQKALLNSTDLDHEDLQNRSRITQRRSKK